MMNLQQMFLKGNIFVNKTFEFEQPLPNVKLLVRTGKERCAPTDGLQSMTVNTLNHRGS